MWVRFPPGAPGMLTPKFFTLEKAIELGEYNPEVLSQFGDFKVLSRHSQFQLIGQALKNRKRQLWMQWAEINNQLNFSKKPYLEEGLSKIKGQLDELDEDEERLLLEYSG